MSVVESSFSDTRNQSALEETRGERFLPASSPIKVFPEEVTIRDYEVDVDYVVRITIQNQYQTVRRVRLVHPATKEFSLSYTPSVALAAGLETHAELHFKADALKNYYDKLTVAWEDGSVDIPLSARQPGTEIRVEGSAGFGVVVLGSTVSTTLKLKNVGSQPGNWSIAHEEAFLSISPSSGTLAAAGDAGDSVELKVEVSPEEKGTYRGFATVTADGSDKPLPLEITANVVQHALEFVLPAKGTPVETLNLGILYEGQSRNLKARLFNAGPKATAFTARVCSAALSSSSDVNPDTMAGLRPKDLLIDEATEASPLSPLDFTITPSHGALAPYGSIDVEIGFCPPKQEESVGFRSTSEKEKVPVRSFVAAIIVEAAEARLRASVALLGKSTQPMLTLSHHNLDFGVCDMYDRRDVIVNLKNSSEELPAEFKFGRLAHFHISPAEGRLLPLQSRDISISFVPNQLGRLEGEVSLVACSGSYTDIVRLAGISQAPPKGKTLKRRTVGGTDKLPTDFAPALNFVEPESFAEKPPKSLFKRRFAWETGSGDDREIPMTVADVSNEFALTTEELKSRFDHRQKYADFLKTQRVRRQKEKRIKEAEAYVRSHYNEQSYAQALGGDDSDEEPTTGKAKRQKPVALLPLGDKDALKIPEPFFDSRDIGLRPGNGLKSPVPKLPEANDELWLLQNRNAGSEDSGAMKPRTKAGVHDPNRLIKKKFKSKPTTQTETRDCKATLTPRELNRISCGPRTIDYGLVCVGSTVKKCFSVQNETKANILVSMIFSDETFAGSSPSSQVIPPGATAGFDICLSAKSPKSFRKEVDYIINGLHTFQFEVVASFVPVTLQLSQNELSFSFDDNSLELSTSNMVTIKNPGNTKAEYRWIEASGTFRVEPSSGSVDPFGSEDVVVTFFPILEPPKGKAWVEDLHLHVESGNGAKLKCVGENVDAKCALVEKKIDFGAIPIGDSRELHGTIKNLSDVDAVFHVDTVALQSAEAVALGLAVSPLKGKLGALSRTELTVSIKPTSDCSLEALVPVSVHFRGGKTLQFPVVARPRMPAVEIAEDEFDFGGITLGAEGELPLTLSNEGIVPANLRVDFSRYPDFALSLEEPEREGGMTAQEKAAAETGNNASFSGKHSIDDDLEILTVEGGNENGRGGVYDICVPPQRTISLFVHFFPSRVGPQALEFPVSLISLPKPPSLRRAMAGEGLRPLLLVSPSTSIDFRQRVLLRADSRRKSPYKEELELTNGTGGGDQTARTLRWSLRVPSHSVFSLTPTAGILEPGASCTISVVFTPVEAVNFVLKVPVMIEELIEGADPTAEGEGASSPFLSVGEGPYLTLDCRGQGIHPTLAFDRREVTMPVVPIGMESRTIFYVINQGYDNLELKAKVPSDTARVPINLRFPEGSMIGIAKQRLPVEITFSSKRPMSFSAKIDFLDADGNRFSLPIAGTTDNSILTTFSFVQSNFENLTIVQKEGKAPSIAWKNEAAAAAKKAAELLAWPGVEGVPEVSIDAIAKWLNATATRSNIDSIPDDFIRLKGRPLVDMVEFLSGKSIQNLPRKFSQNKKEAAMQVYQLHDTVLSFLKSHGALLSTVRPEYLLSREDCVRVISIQSGHSGSRGASQTPSTRPPSFAAGAMSSEPSSRADRSRSAASQGKQRELEQIYPFLSRFSWMQVLYQTIKVFMLSKVTTKSFKQLPGIAPSTTARPIEEVVPAAAQKKGGAKAANEARSSNKDVDGGHAASAVASFLVPGLGLSLDNQLLTTSNLYSAAENILLLWVSSHCARVFPQQVEKRRKYYSSFVEDFNDGVAYAGLLRAHVPSLASPGAPLADERIAITGNDFVNIREQNMTAVSDAMRAIGLEYVPSLKELCRFTAREHVLLCLFLYFQLPQFLPKAKILFKGRLNETTTRSIELSNPSKRPIVYTAKLESPNGEPVSEAFTLPAESIRLAPHSATVFAVDFKPRFVRPAAALLILQSKRAGATQAPTMVFQLAADVTSAKPVSSFSSTARLYESMSIEVTVKNPFNAECDFSVHVEQPSPQVNGVVLPVPFWTKASRAKLKKGESTKLQVQYLPFTLGSHNATLHFLDENVGEFVVDLAGETTLPVSVETIKVSTDLKAMIKDVLIPTKNPLVEKTKSILSDRARHAGQSKDKLSKEIGKLIAETGGGRFAIEYTSHYFSGPSDIVIPLEQPKKRDHKRAEKEKEGETEKTGTDKVPVSFQPRAPGVYKCQMILTSGADIRVKELEFQAASVAKKAALEFSVPARQSVSQDIPLLNSADREVNFTAAIQGGDGAFSITPSMIVPGRGRKNLPLVFKPKSVGNYAAELAINNDSSGEKTVYSLRGTAEEALSEGHIELQCAARGKLKHKVKVPAIGNHKDSSFTVETDLPHLSGPDSLHFTGTYGEYEFEVAPPRSGIFYGTISFISQHEAHGASSASLLGATEQKRDVVWYSIELKAGQPKFERELAMSATIRQAVMMEITVSNPSSKTVSFDVDLEGEGLLGPSQLDLSPGETGVYELIFSPLWAGEYDGSITFISETVGEFWYKLKLTAVEPEPVVLPSVECELGRFATIFAPVENPTSEPLSLKIACSNDRNFRAPANVVVGPYGSTTVAVEYVPSSIGKDESGAVSISHAKVGKWVYLVSGKGQKPTKMDPIFVNTTIGSSGSSMMTFVNPLALPVTVSVGIAPVKGEDEKSFQCLLKRMRGLRVAPRSSLQIPLSFTPNRMEEHGAELHVRLEEIGEDEEETAEAEDSETGRKLVSRGSSAADAGVSEDLEWVFPIRGVPEAAARCSVARIRCRARNRWEDVVDITLHSISPSDDFGPLDGEAAWSAEKLQSMFSHELIIPDETSPMVKRVLSVSPVELKRVEEGLLLRYRVSFEPLRPMDTSFEFIIYKNSGARWRYEIQLEATEPEIDDIIQIESTIQHTSSVSFMLTNQFPVRAAFKAFFTPESPVEFSVSPPQGFLERFGSPEGTEFIINFTPTEYGKTLVGRLVITTDDMQWTYEVRGTPPTYVAPKATSRIDAKLPEDFQRSPPTKPRNFLKENMRVPAAEGAKERERTRKVGVKDRSTASASVSAARVASRRGSRNF